MGMIMVEIIMDTTIRMNILIFILIFSLGIQYTQAQQTTKQTKMQDVNWKEKLTPEQYRILREKGTERAFSGALLDNKEQGTYNCAGCGTPLFRSETKYNSGSGWPSFYDVFEEGCINEQRDISHGMVRVEITCSKCDGHLGHVFEDGPKPTGLRYCVNSVSLEFDKD